MNNRMKKRDQLARTYTRDVQGAWLMLGGILCLHPLALFAWRPPGTDRTILVAFAVGYCLIWFALGWRRANILSIRAVLLGILMLWQAVTTLAFPYPGGRPEPLLALMYIGGSIGAFGFGWYYRAHDIEKYARVRFVTDRYANVGAANGAYGYVVQVNADTSYVVEVADVYGNIIIQVVVQRDAIVLDAPK